MAARQPRTQRARPMDQTSSLRLHLVKAFRTRAGTSAREPAKGQDSGRERPQASTRGSAGTKRVASGLRSRGLDHRRHEHRIELPRHEYLCRRPSGDSQQRGEGSAVSAQLRVSGGQAGGIGANMPRGMTDRHCLPKPECDQRQERYDAPLTSRSRDPRAVHDAVILTEGGAQRLQHPGFEVRPFSARRRSGRAAVRLCRENCD